MIASLKKTKPPRPGSRWELVEKFGQLRRSLNLTAVGLLKPFGMGPKQAMVIHHLAARGEACLADLSRATMSDPAATGRVADVLIRRGLIEQRAHPTDRRRWVVRLTPEGNRLAQEVRGVYVRLNEILVAPLSGEERKQFLKLLDKVVAALPVNAESAKCEGGRHAKMEDF